LVFRNRPTIFKGLVVETGATWETYNDAIGMRWASPDITFSNSMSLFWGGPEVHLDYHPGPTPGAIWVSIPDAGVIFVGDTVVQNQPPFLANADLDAWLGSLNVLLSSYSNQVIIGGRGGPITMEDIRAQQKLLKDVISGMEKLASGNAAPDATQGLVPSLLSKYKVNAELKELYAKRLQYGLHQCYARRYRMPSLLGQSEDGEGQ
jgi:glyoxylase-like metal-dependent hydrolase (beta-lactamase superfamily II)